MGEKREEKKNKAMKHLSTPYRGKVRVVAGRKRGEIKNRGVQNNTDNNFVSKKIVIYPAASFCCPTIFVLGQCSSVNLFIG